MTSVQTLAGCRVLVVEDTYWIADDVAQALRRAGAIVVGPAPNRSRAMALLSSEPVDIAVLDINLHGDPIYPLADLLRDRGIPFVFATGYGAHSIPAAYTGVTRLEKPFDVRVLLKAIPTLLPRT